MSSVSLREKFDKSLGRLDQSLREALAAKTEFQALLDTTGLPQGTNPAGSEFFLPRAMSESPVRAMSESPIRDPAAEPGVVSM